MKTKILQFCLLLAFSVLTACFGYEPPKLYPIDQKIYVREYGTNLPIANATIYLFEHHYPGLDGFPDGYPRVFARRNTDANGMVHLEGKMREIIFFTVTVPEPKAYFDIGDGENDWRSATPYYAIGWLTDEFIANPVFSLYPHAWLKFEVDFRKLGGGYDEVRFTSDLGLNGSTKKSGTTAPILVKGNVPHQITFDGFKGGKNIKSWVQEVYIPGHDTLSYQVDAYFTAGR
jgi:hypothetical protein